jgi:hypothetical protein
LTGKYFAENTLAINIFWEILLWKYYGRYTLTGKYFAGNILAVNILAINIIWEILL